LSSQPSNHASVSHRDLASAALPSQSLFFQLYVHRERWRSEKQLAEAKELGYKVVIVTVDVPVPGNRELDLRTSLDENTMLLANPGLEVGKKVFAMATTSACVLCPSTW
jgi:L-lactate dehydrogenase (cytochrome)